MTDSDNRDLYAPPAPAGKPSCPCCGQHEPVGVANHPAGRYACGACWTVFDGTDEEWRRWATRRDHRAKSYAGLRERWGAVKRGAA